MKIYNNDSVCFQDKKSPLPLCKSFSETEARRKLIEDTRAPPVPPPPLNYPSTRQLSGKKLSFKRPFPPSAPALTSDPRFACFSPSNKRIRLD